MIIGIGTDIVQISRIERGLEKFSDKFAQRILTDLEWEIFNGHKAPASFLAKRFAAKEAVAKAFGTGFRQGLSMRHIEVVNDDLGKPQLCLYEAAAKKMQQLDANQTFISISDEKSYAVAFVIISQCLRIKNNVNTHY